MGKTVKKKAIVYCIEKGRLLVFRHIDFPWEQVGVQVPAGSIRENESPEQAALRELREETGFDAFVIHSFLGNSQYDMSPYRHELQERHFYLAAPTKNLPERWKSQENHDGKEAPTRFECFWIPIESGHVLQSGQGAMLWKIKEL